MALLIRGLHIEELIIDMDLEETPLELNDNLVVTSQEPLQGEPPREEPKPAPKKTAPKKNAKPIDNGKVGALYKAGWSVPKIADEMKVSAPTIRKALKEMGLWN